jgi:hypothetical protein
MSIRNRVFAVLGFFATLYLAFHLRTKWGPALLDVSYVDLPSPKPTATPVAPCVGDDYNYCDSKLFSSRFTKMQGSGPLIVICFSYRIRTRE